MNIAKRIWYKSHMDIGTKIKTAREALGLTQGQLGELCGWEGNSQPRIAGYEKNKRQLTPDGLVLMAKALRKPITYFFEDAGTELISEPASSLLTDTVTGNTEDIELLKRIIAKVERISSDQRILIDPEQKARAICALLQTELQNKEESSDATVQATVRALSI